MGELERNHFVPAGLLRLFQHEPSDAARLAVYDVTRHQWRRKQLAKNVAVERRLYDDAGGPGGDLKHIERRFQVAEDRALPVIRRLMGAAVSPREGELELLLEFGALQLSRVPGFRESLKASQSAGSPSLKAKHSAGDINHLMFAWAKEALARMRMCRWFLYEAPLAGPLFVSSDLPVKIVSVSTAVRGTRTLLAISKTLALVGSSAAPNRCLHRVLPWWTPRIRAIPKAVELVNSATALGAKELYSPEDCVAGVELGKLRAREEGKHDEVLLFNDGGVPPIE
jgi:Protein of unknown function (DUF4238)